TMLAVADLRTVAVQGVVALRVVRSVIARVASLVARVCRTANAVAAADAPAVLATMLAVAGFRTVAVEAVVALRVVGGAIARVGSLVARVCRTANAVAAVDDGAVLATVL